ncbi:exonuclease domain-containing protein [Clostridium sp. CX1]|uniref:Exonuclease domain-containing protein n=1 Tax=Clostridium tanneri TaxID=3037988 RepID=A0ABU4JQ21_9CLOT|nr:MULTISPECIES: exonuclease domain-containing protein [unclassified Clostridium]MCT8975288.1 exonuclease domain-containing protein [Clostridium sp. CX1]MDW8800212.1 exonuclease domain-containing protein [Clostridium sp. A1-XYC3]
MNFIAIDFETANEKRNSACSIGIVVVKNGHVVEKIHHLIRPKEMRFMPINIGIHGIRPAMVENEPGFDKVWEKIKHYFNENLVIAHNASFDISVLRKSAELYDIELPSFKYICTMKLARNFYKGIENAKLNTVNDFLGYEFKHHDALQDALACSNILLNISEELKCGDINEISKLIGVTIGIADSSGYKPSSSKGSGIKTSNRIYDHKKETIFERLEKDLFRNEVVVFTGRLTSMSRDEAMRLVRRLGGATGSSVTKKTTILVTNMKDVKDLRREEMSNKLKKATDLNAEGQNIRFLNEEEFLNMRKGS